MYNVGYIESPPRWAACVGAPRYITRRVPRSPTLAADLTVATVAPSRRSVEQNRYSVRVCVDMRMCAALLLCACAALAALAPPRHKRADISPMPFVLGSRYGRSPQRVMSPRNDRFFLTSRYGKRSHSSSGLCRCSPFSNTRESPLALSGED